jgi:hypothetical protein
VSAAVGRHAGRGRRPRLPGTARGPEQERAKIVASLQTTCRSWLVLWSAWRQTYTGFACFTRTPVIVDEATADRFLARLKEIEQHELVGGR